MLKKRYNLIQKFNYKVILKILINIDTKELLQLINYQEDNKIFLLQLLKNLNKKELNGILTERKNSIALEEIQTDTSNLSINETIPSYDLVVFIDKEELLTDEIVQPELLTDEFVQPELLTDEFVSRDLLTDEFVSRDLLTDEFVQPELLTDEFVSRDVSTTFIEPLLVYEYNTKDEPIDEYNTEEEPISEYDTKDEPISEYDTEEEPISKYDTEEESNNEYETQDEPIYEYDIIDRFKSLFTETTEKVKSNNFQDKPIDFILNKNLLPRKIEYKLKEKKNDFNDAIEYFQNIIINSNIDKIKIKNNKNITNINNDIRSKIKLIS
jgi:hypothetical protein